VQLPCRGPRYGPEYRAAHHRGGRRFHQRADGHQIRRGGDGPVGDGLADLATDRRVAPNRVDVAYELRPVEHLPVDHSGQHADADQNRRERRADD
jgi:hypothetical protein